MRVLAIGCVLLGVLMAGVLPAALAQETEKETRAGALMTQGRFRRAEVMAHRLQLSDAQKAKIQDILHRSREQARQIREDTSLTPEQKRERLRELRRCTRQEIGSVLTPEQREKMRRLWAWRWRQGQRWRVWRDIPRFAPPVERAWRARERGGWWKIR